MENYPSGFSILIVDDEPMARVSLKATLASQGITNTVLCEDNEKIFDLIETHKVGIVLLDLVMPGKRGEEILPEILRDHPEIMVIIVSGLDNITTAVECMKKGAFDYITKPVDSDNLSVSIRRAIDMFEMKSEYLCLKRQMMDGSLLNDEAFSDIITQDSRMFSLFQYCEAIAPSQQAVLITGETGTGKELFSQAIHNVSERTGKFVAVNLAGLDMNVLSDALFGHVKGAYTGADKQRAGLVEEAAGGTLFIDEIGEINEEIQVKLLRLLQEREYTPLGSDVTKLSSARIVVATNRDLRDAVKNGSFRKDLYFRLSTHHIHLPPLRERNNDVPLLLDYFLSQACEEMGKKRPGYSEELPILLENYSFPGNVRELRAMVFDAISKHQTMMLSLSSFYDHIKANKDFDLNEAMPQDTDMSKNSLVIPQKMPTLKEMNEIFIKEAMQRSEGRQKIAAMMLGISQQALSQRLKKLAEEGM